MIRGIREYFIKMAVKIIASTNATEPSMIVPRFLMILLLASLSLKPPSWVVFMIYELNFSKKFSMNCAFMLKNSSMHLKKMYALDGTLMLNFSIVLIN